MAFDRLLTDRVKVLSQSGEIIEDVKASVQKNKIFIHRSDILIQTDDLIHRVMSNGVEETYKVIDPGFREGLGRIPAGYQIEVQKLGIPAAKSAIQNITYNISGTNNRINQNSADNSVNIININPDMQEHICALRDAIKRLEIAEGEATEHYKLIDAIEAQLSSEKPSKTVVQTLLSGLPHAGSISSVGSLIVSLLE